MIKILNGAILYPHVKNIEFVDLHLYLIPIQVIIDPETTSPRFDVKQIDLLLEAVQFVMHSEHNKAGFGMLG